MLLAVARLAENPGAMAQASQVTGLPPADLSRRLAGILPRVLLPAIPGDQAERMTDQLEALGFVVFWCEASAAPSDADRLVVHALDLEPSRDGTAGLCPAEPERGKQWKPSQGFHDSFFLAHDGQGQPHPCPGSAIALLQRGARVTVTCETVKTTARKLDMGKALLTGGLLLTSKVEKTTSKRHEQSEDIVLIQRSDGEPDLILYERRLDYRFLGRDKQPASRANLDLTLARLRALAPDAPFDDRAAKPGFVTGLPLTHTDPLDLALFLISLARTRGC